MGGKRKNIILKIFPLLVIKPQQVSTNKVYWKKIWLINVLGSKVLASLSAISCAICKNYETTKQLNYSPIGGSLKELGLLLAGGGGGWREILNYDNTIK